MFRSWQGCFVLTGLVFLLQLFPITGIFLMMLAAPYWSVLLINLGFVLMARDALTGAQPRWLIAAPLLWFGGYLGAAALSHWEAARFDAAIAAANAGTHFRLDPARQDVLIAPEDRPGYYGDALSADRMVTDFGMNRVHQVVDRGRGTTRRTELIRIACPGVSGVGTEGEKSWRKLADGGYGTGRKMVFAHALCLFSWESAPQHPVYRVHPADPRDTKGLVDRVSQDITVTAPDGQTTVLRSGFASPLSWFPQPVMGCALDSGTPKWACDAGFLRERRFGGANGAPQVVARAFGLPKATLRERVPDADWR